MFTLISLVLVESCNRRVNDIVYAAVLDCRVTLGLRTRKQRDSSSSKRDTTSCGMIITIKQREINHKRQ